MTCLCIHTYLPPTVSLDIDRAMAVKSEMLPVWKKFLLNQFHDVLPGSCIEKVVQDVLSYYEGMSVCVRAFM